MTLHPAGGGVAGVSRLIWETARTRWAPDARLITLVPRTRDASLETSTIDRLAFGARLAALHAAGRCTWTFYTHLSLAKVESFVPVRRRPYIVFLHGIEAWRPLTQAETRVLSGATLRVANSTYTAQRVRAQHPAVGPVAICPLAVPPPWSTAPTPHDRFRFGPRAVVIVARMAAGERYKGHDALLAAWPAVRAQQPDARLVIVGSGDDESRLRAQAEAAGVGAGVTFAGFVSEAELAAIYAHAAVFARPSRGEGFGIAYLEAMAHGLPCIGSVHDAAGEVIEDGVTGYLIDQSDTQALADRVSLLLGDDTRRRAMGEAGRRRLMEHFTADQFARRLGDLVDRALGGETPSAAWHASRMH